MEDITITEITDVAGVGRSTYYRNFTSKEDVLSYKLFILGYRWLVKEKLSSDMESVSMHFFISLKTDFNSVSIVALSIETSLIS